MAIKQECNSNGERVTFAIKVCFFFQKRVFFVVFMGSHFPFGQISACEQMFAKATVISFLFSYFMRKSPERFSSLFPFLFVTGFFVVVVVRFPLTIYCNYQLGMIFAVDMNQPLANSSVFAPVKYVG